MTGKKSILLVAMAATMLSAGAARISLDSESGAQWQLCPQDDLAGVAGAAVSAPGFSMPGDAVAGVVPGVVFTAYVDAGKEQDPDYADNIYRVDESFYSRPFWYRTEFDTPADYRNGRRVWINFDNTNRYADFYVNGTKLSGTPESTKDVSGHMMRTRYDITDLLSPDGHNAVAVLITDADQRAQERRPLWGGLFAELSRRCRMGLDAVYPRPSERHHRSCKPGGHGRCGYGRPLGTQ